MAKGKGKDKVGEENGAEPGFEQSLERLEEIVGELEGSDVPLERALLLFEEGVKLGRACSARLDEAERKITLLLEQSDGSLVEQGVDAGSLASAASQGASPARRAKPAPPASRSPAPDDDDDDSIPF